MAMRLSEVHPALVHVPLTLLPVAVGTDAFAKATGNRKLYDAGRCAIVGAAIAAAFAGVFGLIAQEEVYLDEQGQKILKTHRTLNLGLLGVLTTLAVVRVSRKKPSLGYLIAGLTAVALAGFAAYLGGKLVYDHGAGVKRIGVGASDPELTARNALRAIAQAARDLGRGVKHAAEDMKKGDIVPALK